MKANNKSIYIITILAIVIIFLYQISNILTPFIIGIIISYFLDPAADKLETKGFSRTTSTLLILLGFISMTSLFFVVLGPILYHQLFALVTSIPEYIKYINNLMPSTEYLYSLLGIEYKNNMTPDSSSLEKLSKYIFQASSKLATNIWHSGIAIINIISLIFITPVVTFYLLRDWDKMTNFMLNIFPKKYKNSISSIFTKIDLVLSAYVRGQTNVCLLLGLFYAIALTIADLKYGLLIGFLTGIFAFIPYFGVIIGMSIGIIVALLQFDSYTSVFIIFTIFIAGQFIEGNFVTPKLVGQKIGIHPVIIIFALLAGGALFGFLGILFAIPVTAILSVILKTLLTQYLDSKYYNS